MSERNTHGLGSTRAVISYAQMTAFFLTLAGIFWIIAAKVTVESLMAGILGTVLGTTSQGFSGVRSYWLSTSGQPTPATKVTTGAPPGKTTIETEEGP